MRMQKWMLSLLIAVLVLSSGIANPKVLAASLTDMKEEKNALDQKKNNINLDIQKKKSEISTNKTKIESIQEQISKLDTEINGTNQKITTLENEITETTKEIEALTESIELLEKKIQERDEVLRERVRAMQVNGGSVNYLDVLLGANSFSDFVDRISTVTTLMEADKTIMQEQAEDQKQLEEEKKLVEQKLEEQETNKSKLEDLKASLQSQKDEQDKLAAELKKEQEKLNKEKANLETAFEETHELSKELEAEIVAEQNRQIEAARKAAEEKKRQEEAAKAKAAQSKSSSGSSSKSSGGGSNVSAPSTSTPAVSSGTWTRPASGRLTSGFGSRIHPITGQRKTHNGVDVANSVGTSIVAAGDGVVFRAGWHYSFGNHIMITHSINGQTYTTVYAHLSSIGVSTGQTVNKGQYIGGMGSTGHSTGSHLHFELHRGVYSSANAINPIGIVPF